MLRDLLALIASGRGGTKENIALTLGLRAAEVDEMFSRLLELGYIEDFAASCASCASCSASCSMCAAGGFGAKAKVWALSAKGKEALRA
jgi:hypothetical protein